MAGVAPHPRPGLGQLDGEGDPRVVDLPREGERVPHHLARVEVLEVRVGPLLAEAQQVLGDLAAATGERLDPLEELAVRTGRGRRLEEELRVPEDPGERVVDLVGDPRAELAEGGELLRLDELRLRRPQLCGAGLDVVLQLLVPALELLPRRLELLRHAVEGAGDLRDLVVPSVRQAHRELSAPEGPRRGLDPREAGHRGPAEEEGGAEDEEQHDDAREEDPAAHPDELGLGGRGGDHGEDAPPRAVLEGRPGAEDALPPDHHRTGRVEPAGELGPVLRRQRPRAGRGEEDPRAVEEVRRSALRDRHVEAPLRRLRPEAHRDEPALPVPGGDRPDRGEAPAAVVVVGGEDEPPPGRRRRGADRLDEPVGGRAPVACQHRASGPGRVHDRARVRRGDLPREDDQHPAELLLDEPVRPPGLGEAAEGGVHRGELRRHRDRPGAGPRSVLGVGAPRELVLRAPEDGERHADERRERGRDDEERELALEGHRGSPPSTR